VLLSTRDGSVRSSAPVGKDLVAITLSDNGSTAFLADSKPGDVYAVGVPDLEQRWRRHLGAAPFGMLVHKGLLFVTLYDGAAIVVLDPASGRILDTVPTQDRPAALAVDGMGNVVAATGAGFGIALASGRLWTTDYERSALVRLPDGFRVDMPLRLHPFWLAAASDGRLLISAEGDDEDRDPGAVFSYDPMSSTFTTLARARDPDEVIESDGAIYVAAHGDHEVLSIRDGHAEAWAKGAGAVALAPDPKLGLLAVVVNAHE
jgi:sugar lactone lactonase YvrE